MKEEEEAFNMSINLSFQVLVYSCFLITNQTHERFRDQNLLKLKNKIHVTLKWSGTLIKKM